MPEKTDKPIVLLDQQLCFALYATSRAFTKVYADLLADLDLTYPQYVAMLVLWERDGLSVQEIADRLELEGATATPLIQRLEKLGLVSKKRSAKDERRLDVFLTEKGKAMRLRAQDVPERLGCAVGVSDAKAALLLDELKALRASMS